MIRAAPWLALVAVVLGILVGERMPPAPAGASLVVASALLVLAWPAPRGIRLVLVLVGVLLLGAGVTRRAEHGLASSPVADLAAARPAVVVRGALADDPDPSRFVVRVPVRVAEVDAGRQRWQPHRIVLVRAAGDAASRLRVLEAGDRVTLGGRLTIVDARDQRWRWRHAAATLEADDLLAFAAPDAPVVRVASSARTAVLRGSDGLPAPERALLAGFLLGDTRAIAPAVVDAFRAAGLSHLLAVSGANLAFVLLVLQPLARRLSLGGRLVVGVTAIAVFGTMTRWEPSVLRAAALAIAVLVADCLGRRAHGARLLPLAASALLLADPFLLHSVGFLLSFGATAGIVLVSPVLAARLPGPTALREAAAVALAAQAGVAPVQLAVFGQVPLVALPANLLAVPVVGPVTVWGLGAGVVGGWLGPGVSRVLQLPTYGMLRWVETVAGLAARHPVAVGPRGAAVAAVAVVVLTLVWPRVAARRPAAPREAVPDRR